MAVDPRMIMAMQQQGSAPTPQPTDLTPEQLMMLISMLQGSGTVLGGGQGVGGGQPPMPTAAMSGVTSPIGPTMPPPSQNLGAPGMNGPAPAGAQVGGGNVPPEIIQFLAQQGAAMPPGSGMPAGMGPIPAGPPPPQNPTGPIGGPGGGLPESSAPLGAGGPPSGGGPASTPPPAPADVNQKTPAQVVAEDDSKLWLDALQRMATMNATGINEALANGSSSPVDAIRTARSYDPGNQQNQLEALLAMLSRKAPQGGPPQGGPPPGGK